MIYLAAAFIAVWLIITIYVLYMAQRQRRLEQELQILEELLQDRNVNR